ncbi:hypothetical protein B0H63DRAFT_450109 [Podospora didyma]|uniref:Uncharacterized protein n=1 Tax=Podospora didyma TaxID=330526 RepID=A0AAE0NR40_9PEZI|nr:hypothetical protein B0H63DRAFT_450109 [Podospora didyma]
MKPSTILFAILPAVMAMPTADQTTENNMVARSADAPIPSHATIPKPSLPPKHYAHYGKYSKLPSYGHYKSYGKYEEPHHWKPKPKHPKREEQAEEEAEDFEFEFEDDE